MNKFICFAILAFAAYATAASIEDDQYSESRLNPDDAEETALLKGDMIVFSDFCRRSRDHVTKSIKNSSNEVGSNIFTTIMNSADAVGREVLNAQGEATDRLSAQLANPDAPIAEAKTGIEENLVAAQKKIQEEQTQPKTLLEALKATVATSVGIVSARVTQGFETLKAQLGITKALAMVEKGCDLMAQYDSEIRDMFEETKKTIVEENEQFKNLSVEQVPCITSRRVIRAHQVCNFAKSVQGPVTKLMQTRN